MISDQMLPGQSLLEIRQLSEQLNFSDYTRILGVCRRQEIAADDVLAFLGTMTDDKGFGINRTLGDVAGFMINRFKYHYDIGLRQTPEEDPRDPKESSAALFRFMLVQFFGMPHSAGSDPQRPLPKPTLPLIEIQEERAAPINSTGKQSIELFDRNIRLSDYGKRMYFRLLLQLGNMEYKLAGNNQRLEGDSFDLAQRAIYKKLYKQKMPGLKDYLGIP